MLFTSYSYLIFLAVAVLVHWSLPPRLRNGFLVAASYAFYAAFRWEFALLLLAVTLFNWVWARWVLAPRPTALALTCAVAVNLLPLAAFKYLGFALQNAAWLVDLLGGSWRPGGVDLLLPLGISFYTFQSIAYLVDVAAGEPPFRALGDMLLFQAFWPKLLAGPIVRAEEMRESIQSARSFDYEDLSAGMTRLLLGLFKKVVLADNLAPIVQMVFDSHGNLHALDAAAGTLGAGLQIYFDFAGYTDMAIGSARLLGFRLPENFNWPYLSRSPQEFWNRWHVTLSRWIRDYLFTPLSFASRGRPGLLPVWLLVSMGLCGLWHGAAWTFVCWGLWHGLLLIANQGWLRRVFVAPRTAAGPLRSAIAFAATFVAVQLGWILFRAASLEQAWEVFQPLILLRGGIRPALLRENAVLTVALMFLGLMAAQAFEAWPARLRPASHRFRLLRAVGRPLAFTALILAIIIFDQEASAFVYFQF